MFYTEYTFLFALIHEIDKIGRNVMLEEGVFNSDARLTSLYVIYNFTQK